MEIPIWMATAISELGLTKQDFDDFFVEKAARTNGWKTEPSGVQTYSESWKKFRSRRVQAPYESSMEWCLRRFVESQINEMCFGDDALMPICDED